MEKKYKLEQGSIHSCMNAFENNLMDNLFENRLGETKLWMYETEYDNQSFDVTWSPYNTCISIHINKRHNFPCSYIFFVYHDEELIITYNTFMIANIESFDIPYTLKNMAYDIFVSYIIDGILIKNHEKIGTFAF